MARGGRGGSHSTTRRPIDLTGAISVAERNDLSTLINAITERMNSGISNIFDSPPVSPVEDEFHQHHWLSLSLKDREEKENRNHTSRPVGSAHLTPDQTNPEGITPQLQELRKEALVSFRRWQAAVIQRLRDISIKETGDGQSSFRGRGRGARGVRGNRGAARGGRGGGRGGLTLATG
jgi:hypothetical protein